MLPALAQHLGSAVVCSEMARTDLGMCGACATHRPGSALSARREASGLPRGTRQPGRRGARRKSQLGGEVMHIRTFAATGAAVMLLAGLARQVSRRESSATSGFPSPPANSLLSWTACSNDDHSGRSHRAKIRTPRSPRGQHGSSTRSGNDGHQPGTTGITLGHPARPAGPPTDPRGRRATKEIPADQRKRRPARYFSSWRAITMRWI